MEYQTISEDWKSPLRAIRRAQMDEQNLMIAQVYAASIRKNEEELNINMVDEETLKLKDQQDTVLGEGDGRSYYAFERSSARWLQQLNIVDFGGAAKLTRVRHGNPLDDYVRLTQYDKASSPEWSVADKNMSGNALYGWTAQRSLVDPDTAFGGTKRLAVQLGCFRVIHPAGFTGEWGTKESEVLREKILSELEGSR